MEHMKKVQIMRKNKLLLLMLCLIMLMPLLTGCTAKKVFVTDEDLYSLTPYADTELKLETFYIKNGAKFYETYIPKGHVTGRITQYSREKYYWLQKDASLIPSLYKDEIIAYASTKEVDLKDLKIERYYDVGYSIGIYGGAFDNNGYYCITLSNNVIKDSSAYKALSKASASDIRIVEFNNKPIDENMLNDGGIFKGIEQGETCEIGYYAGTFYETATITSDYYYLQSYETMSVDNVTSTKNGYLAITLPSDAKSGYYRIDGGGLFKYYSYERGEKVDSEENMNENYYKAGEETDFSHAQQYSLTVGSKTQNVTVDITYDKETGKEEDISFILMSPSGIDYEIAHEKGKASIELAEMMAGKWLIYVYPKTLEINNIDVLSAAQDPDAKKEVYTFTIDEEDENAQFFCKYSGTGKIWGTVSREDGEAEILEELKENGEKYLGVTYGYLSPGTYTMTIYHYMDTAVVETGVREDSSSMEEEIIYVED